MQEFNEIANNYRKTFEGWEEIKAQQEAAGPDIADVFIPTIDVAIQAMSTLEELGAAESFAEAMQPKQSEEVIRRKAAIEGQRDLALYPDVITEEHIQTQLAALPAPVEFSEEDKRFAQAYFVGKFMASPIALRMLTAADSSTSMKVAEQPHSAAEGIEPSAVEGESNQTELHGVAKEQLIVEYYLKDQVIVFGDQEVMLTRKIESGGVNIDQEQRIERARILILSVLAANPDTAFTGSDFWTLLDPLPGEEYNSYKWYKYFGEFLSELQYEGQPLLDIRKPSPDAKIRTYQLGDFNLQIEGIDADSKALLLGTFKHSDSEWIIAKAGMLMHLLTRSSHDEPVTEKMILEAGFYTEEELQKYKPPYLSGLISSLRANLRRLGIDDLYQICSRKLSQEVYPTPTGVLATGYYLDNDNNFHPDDEPEKQSHDMVIGDPSDMLPSQHVEHETAEERRIRIHRASVVASFIDARQPLLEQLGLPRIERHTVETLLGMNDHYETVNSEEQKNELEHLIIDRFIEKVQDDHELERMMDQLSSSEDDPRWAIIDYLSLVVNDPDARATFIAAIRATETVIAIDPISQEVTIAYEVDNHGKFTVSVEGDSSTSHQQTLIQVVNPIQKEVIKQSEKIALDINDAIREDLSKHNITDKEVALVVSAIDFITTKERNVRIREIIQKTHGQRRIEHSQHARLLKLLDAAVEAGHISRKGPFFGPASDSQSGAEILPREVPTAPTHEHIISVPVSEEKAKEILAMRLGEEVKVRVQTTEKTEDTTIPALVEAEVSEVPEELDEVEEVVETVAAPPEDTPRMATVTPLFPGSGEMKEKEEKRLGNREQREQKKIALLKAANKEIGRIINELADDLLEEGREFTITQAQQVLPHISSRTFARIMGEKALTKAQRGSEKADIKTLLFVVLACSSDPVISKAAGQSRPRKELQAAVETAVDKRRRAIERKQRAASNKVG